MSPAVRVDEQPLWQLAVVEAGFAAAALAILFVRRAFGAVALALPLWTEVAIGLPLGAASGALLGLGLLRSPLRPHVVQGVLPLRPVASSLWSIAAAGLLAGLGEELLFRAALQTWLGLSWASVLFGLAHSGTARLHQGLSIRKMAYLLASVAAGALLGTLYQRAGLLASISAHAAFDIAILLVLAPEIAAAGRG